ncbi:unnamed protein product [Spirodela intermedia]|uniref:Ubiquitin-like domain-containing protein n=1 Tax=Spirodela intermedia TaxID=51605 RepID=A0A7I8KBV7_SPIIN|nr:unnamed protein product [Spirodela intermedia]
MRVAVENVAGRFLFAEVEEGEEQATVGRLKIAIAGAEEEAAQAQRMILVTAAGRVMAEDQTALAQYGVSDGSVVYLYFSPDGSTSWHRSYEDYLTIPS